ncbi:glucose-6-phosphate dehydrogenase [Paenibacillus silvae]|uniref:Glucose-6-phosphate 1-dehydrogenase n=1 Tax=Paenibacillus silvae TaxID=1325358 RepID=A0ABQ1YWU1_9BACL|nr:MULTISPECIES: glucose-6-phosphate dehydrogenase [Paenibacillus]MCK6076506.1 glucose-6-phosphate dehydrogenase [Paenibacillus silvae]MCK6150933.1 glucose-6-phosphate dehydrogenase [Paenibacillus silvae]MCK6269193.1 glucose-6-phosphate dehydrogenase [Paenibacillus silvae]GGH41656.1 glucose-6-phosphate 1-dehydrogenase [Paenibacillus silvae]
MEPTTIVLFGATGDLAKRKIYPALYNLYLERKLPETFSLIGLGRREWSDEFFQAQVEKSLHEFSRRQGDHDSVKSFVKAFRYSVLNISHKEDYIKLLQLVEQREAELGIPSNRLFYLSVGPEFFEPIAENIQSSGLGSTQGWKRLVIEKPFGHDLQSARDLNRKLSESFTEEEIYRIDHYLGKPMVQKLETLHQSNPIMKALWNNRYISNVQITANETVGVEERASYYDHVGAVRDMFQNHMLQLLMMMAIQLPYNSTSENVGQKKKHIMESIQPLQKQTVGASIIRGQYAAGSIQGKPVHAYTDEPGVAENTMNDTFIAAKLQIDDFFWRGVPFYIRTGKRMKEKSTRIVIEFKEPSGQGHLIKNNGSKPNLLVIEMSPDQSMTLQLNASDPENKGEFKPVHIDLAPDQGDLAEAYENLIRDALHGDPTFFAHWDEVELSWAWVQPILDAFNENLLPLHLYAAGSYGPAESDAMLEADGHHWWFDEPSELISEEDSDVPIAVNGNI